MEKRVQALESSLDDLDKKFQRMLELLGGKRKYRRSSPAVQPRGGKSRRQQIEEELRMEMAGIQY